ncbi:MAG: hypothetical protein M0Q41_04855 [Bacteroidales bacterium]|nr:hypothetical protein [Bacteroidales bacterium]
MDMRNPFLFLFFSLLLFFSACSTDVDNYADYKDVTIVYGLLETDKDTTYIKITKAFLGPGNALVFAQNPDSSNYSGKLDVKLIGKQNSNTLPAITLDTITIKNKQAGDSIFYFPEQKLYYTTAPIYADAQYTLEINKGSEIIRAQTVAVKDFSVLKPNNRINFAATTTVAIQWNTAENGKRYEVQLVFYYDELHQGTSDTIHQSMTWKMGTKTADRLDGTEKLEINYLGEAFYSRLNSELKHDPNIRRFAGPVDLIISCAGDELNTYIDVNAPSNSIIQEIPEYTNIENGYGIFSSRKILVKSYLLSVQSELKLVQNPDWGFELRP